MHELISLDEYYYLKKKNVDKLVYIEKNENFQLELGWYKVDKRTETSWSIVHNTKPQQNN